LKEAEQKGKLQMVKMPVITLETQVKITKHRNTCVNTDTWTYWRWEQVSSRSKHPFSTGHTRCEHHFNRKNQQTKSVYPDQTKFNGTIQSNSECLVR
jgi:hypothetical protein